MTDGMPSQTLDLNDVVRRDAKMMSADVHDETVLLDVDSGACFGFDPVGSRIWALIEQPQRGSGPFERLEHCLSISLASAHEEGTGDAVPCSH